MNRLIVCLAVVVLVAGCSGARSAPPDAGKSKAPTSSPTIPPVAEPPPAMPASAKTMSVAGGRAFARYVLDVHNYALRTGETKELRGVLAPECFLCLTIPELVESAYRGGGRIAGGLWIPRSAVEAVPSLSEPEDRGFFQVSIHLEPMTTYAAHGDAIATEDGSIQDRALMISTSWRDGQWYVEQFHGVGGQKL